MSEIANDTTIEWTDDQWKNFTNWLKVLLQDNVVEVVFTKANGEERTMRATKNSTTIDRDIQLKLASGNPDAIKEKKTRRKSAEINNNILVWDVDISDWRTFNVRKLNNILTIILKYDYREPNLDGWFHVET